MPERGAAGGAQTPPTEPAERKNSILIVLGTDAPLQAHQLRRLAGRAVLGLGRNGATARNFSGEFALAFSTTYRIPLAGAPQVQFLVNDNDEELLNGLFAAAVQAVEEAEVNQLVASKTMVGVDGAKVYGLPADRLVQILRLHNRLSSNARSGEPQALQ